MSTQNTHGGRRTGAGRKAGFGSYAEPTVTQRIPMSLVPTVKAWLAQYRQSYAQSQPAQQSNPTAAPHDALHVLARSQMRIPVALESVRAGFPSPAAPYIADYLDFNEYLVSHPAATIAVYAKGDSMILAGIDDGDMLVVDRALEATHRSIALVELDNEYTVKRVIRTELGVELHPENPQYPIIQPRDGETLNLVGVVTHIIKKAC